uniref:Protein kinase domain-containing protein n=1 Tax=Solanum lycopersicum TaxID=4081 RepID=A0A3Q7EXX5_SOLLC
SRVPHQAGLLDPVPYKSARTSRHQLAYQFSMKPEYKFIRLHLKPASYIGFYKSKSIFTVKTVTSYLPLLYLVRLHFCEIEPTVTDEGQTNFTNIINNQNAEDDAHVIKWRCNAEIKSGKTNNGISSGEHQYRQFSLDEMERSMNNFDPQLVIDSGGYGTVYKGDIDGGEATVAVKRSKPGSSQGKKESLMEIKMLSTHHHENILSLIGYFNEMKVLRWY